VKLKDSAPSNSAGRDGGLERIYRVQHRTSWGIRYSYNLNDTTSTHFVEATIHNNFQKNIKFIETMSDTKVDIEGSTPWGLCIGALISTRMT
jgi:hypothetical protein